MTICLTIACASCKQEPQEWNYSIDEFADIEVLRYQIPAWDGLKKGKFTPVSLPQIHRPDSSFHICLYIRQPRDEFTSYFSYKTKAAAPKSCYPSINFARVQTGNEIGEKKLSRAADRLL